MKRILIMVMAASVLAACTSKQTDQTSPPDSLATDSSDLAAAPASSALSFSPLAGFSVNDKVKLEDTVSYFIFANADEMGQLFTPDKNVRVAQPDFIINYIVGIAMQPTQALTTITLDKVVINDRDIDVYVNIQKGATQSAKTKPSQVFAIEKRDGYVGMQFYVNGRKDKAFILPM